MRKTYLTEWQVPFAITVPAALHSVELMVDIVAELTKAGMSDEWIKKYIGMDADELLRLKQISGLMELFADKEFSIPEEA